MGGGKFKKIVPFKSIMFCYDYPRPAVTVDIVVFSSDASEVLPKLAFDHTEIIQKALETIK